MITDAQLEEIKVKLENADRTFKDILIEDYQSKKIGKIRQRLVKKYGKEEVTSLIREARINSLSVEELNDMISSIQARLDRIIAIRDSKVE